MKPTRRMHSPVVYLIAVSTLLLGVTPANADSPVFEYPENGHLYQRIDLKLGWHEAQASCQSWKGHLVTITSAGENEFVFDHFAAPGSVPWLGGTDEDSEGSWRWVTGEPWAYSNWWPGEPSNYCDSTCDNYLAIPDHRVNHWGDVPDENRSYVCEWDTESPERTLRFAQFGTGGTLQFDLVLSNPSRTLAATGTLSFWDPNGNPIDSSGFLPDGVDFELQPQGCTTFSTTGVGEVVTGSAAVTSDLPVAGVVRFFLPNAGLAGVGSSEPAGAVIVPVRREGRLSSGVAIRNAHQDNITVDLTLRDEDGQIVANGTAVRHIPVNGRVSEFIEQYFPNADTASFEGTMSIEVRSGEVAVIGLELEVGGVNPKFTTLPVAPMTHEKFAANLTPRRPAGWSDRIVISKIAGTNTDSSDLTTQDTLYIDHAVLNNGKIVTATKFQTDLLIDGALFASDYSDSALEPDGWAHWQDHSIGKLSAGTHAITIRVDSPDEIHEGNEADNEYTKFITISAEADGTFNGTWSGTTGQERPLSFEVEDGHVTLVTLDVQVQGTACTATISGGVRVTPGAAITDHSFIWSYADPWGASTTLSGTFSSSTTASGTLTATSQTCNGTLETSWSATKD